MTLQGWQGPLPPPDALRAFEEACPGAAKDILQEFKAEADHRRKQEDREARLQVRQSLIGQLSALIFGLAALGVAGFAALHGAQWLGGIVGGGVIVSGMVALLSGRSPSRTSQKSDAESLDVSSG
jgi:uncharacterized membrane protein